MNITLDNDEIQVAIKEYLGNQGINLEQRTVEVTLIAGRSRKSHQAHVVITRIADKTEDTPETSPSFRFTPNESTEE